MPFVQWIQQNLNQPYVPPDLPSLGGSGGGGSAGSEAWLQRRVKQLVTPPQVEIHPSAEFESESWVTFTTERVSVSQSAVETISRNVFIRHCTLSGISNAETFSKLEFLRTRGILLKARMNSKPLVRCYRQRNVKLSQQQAETLSRVKTEDG